MGTSQWQRACLLGCASIEVNPSVAPQNTPITFLRGIALSNLGIYCLRGYTVPAWGVIRDRGKFSNHGGTILGKLLLLSVCTSAEHH